MQRMGKWRCKKEFQIAKLLVLGSFEQKLDVGYDLSSV